MLGDDSCAVSNQGSPPCAGACEHTGACTWVVAATARRLQMAGRAWVVPTGPGRNGQDQLTRLPALGFAACSVRGTHGSRPQPRPGLKITPATTPAARPRGPPPPPPGRALGHVEGCINQHVVALPPLWLPVPAERVRQQLGAGLLRIRPKSPPRSAGPRAQGGESKSPREGMRDDASQSQAKRAGFPWSVDPAGCCMCAWPQQRQLQCCGLHPLVNRCCSS